MRFGFTLGAAGEGRSPHEMAELAALAERSGWDGVFLEDYLIYQGEQDMPTYSTWVVLAAMAAATTRIRLGTNVTPVPRRRPWQLASEAATLDHLSGGRVILGAGLGDLEPGFTAAGEATDTRVRAARLDEALEIIDRLWRGEEVHYEGEHYRVTGLQLAARPVQRPRIPVWVGGDLLIGPVRRRIARWDGCTAYKGRGTGQPITVEDVREIVELAAQVRGGAAGFDVRVKGEEVLADLPAYEAAGATWWSQWIPPGGFAETSGVIRRGPPRAGR